MATQPILKQGCCWRVGDGSSIQVTKDRWILNHPTNMIIHPPLEEEWEWRVADLINWRIKAWDRDFIESTFQGDDAKAILCIPLSRRYAPNVIFWHHTKNGEYSVKSGYHTARWISKQERDMGKSLRVAYGSSVKKKLWKIHIINKIKTFGWRACQNALPTWENLVHHRIIEDGRCELYKQARESMIHVLWNCGGGVGHMGWKYEAFAKGND